MNQNSFQKPNKRYNDNYNSKKPDYNSLINYNIITMTYTHRRSIRFHRSSVASESNHLERKLNLNRC